MLDSTTLTTQKTAADLVEAYHFAQERIQEATRLIYEAQARIDDAFGTQAYVDIKIEHSRHRTLKQAIEETEKRMRGPAWRRIVNISNVTRVMSTQGAEEMRKNLYSDNLPEVTLQEVMGMLETLFGNVNNFAEQAVREVYDILTPASREYGQGQYKTNDRNARFEIGKKVILTWIVEQRFGGELRIRYGGGSEDKLCAIDRVFHALDGNLRAMEHTNRTPLIDAINTTSGGVGQTDYFFFKAYKNGNLHLEFKRPDLLARLNAVGGRGDRLRG